MVFQRALVSDIKELLFVLTDTPRISNLLVSKLNVIKCNHLILLIPIVIDLQGKIILWGGNFVKKENEEKKLLKRKNMEYMKERHDPHLTYVNKKYSKINRNV